MCLGCFGLGFLLSPGMLALAQLGTLWIRQTAAATVHRLGSHLTTPQIQQQLGISRQCADRKGAGFSFELQPLCLGVPNPGDPLSCELALQETPQHLKALQAQEFLSSSLAIPPTLDPLEVAGGLLRV